MLLKKRLVVSKTVFVLTVVMLSFATAIAYGIATQTIPGVLGIQTSPDIRKITPPKLEKANLGKHILCHRPMREGAPKMNVEIIKDKIIANNYGHGGSGWTLAPGAAEYVVGLLKQEMENQHLSYDTPIAVVGAGVIGLFGALELLQQGYKNITVIAEDFDNLPSHNAGGLLAPVSMDNDHAMLKLIDKIAIDAYVFYKNIAEGNNKIITEGVHILPAYFETREASGLEPYVGKVMQPAKEVIIDFQNGTTRKMLAYDDGIFMDTGHLMTSLRKALSGKVTFEKRKINDFSEISQKVIINSTGYGAKELMKDKEMVSVQGHLIMLKNENPEDLKYMILVYFPKGKTKSGFPVERSFYMFPKKLPGSSRDNMGVIGGTFIEGADATHPNTEEFDILLEGAKRFYGIDNNP